MNTARVILTVFALLMIAASMVLIVTTGPHA